MEGILFRQSCIMFLLIALGVFLVKKEYLSEQGGKELGIILLRIVIPCVILKSYIRDYSAEGALLLVLSVFFSLLALITAMIVSFFIFGVRKRVENFASSFCNVGFVGIPMVMAVFGEKAVFYLASFVALLNIFQWTYGVMILTGEKDSISGKAVISNPVVLSFVFGIVLYFLRVPVPKVVTDALGSVGAMNTPLAMIILGTYVAKIKVNKIFCGFSALMCVLSRLIIIPVVTLAVFSLIPFGNLEIKQTILIGACTPVGANIAIFAKQYNKDYKLSALTVCSSTILSIVTVPMFCMLMEYVLSNIVN